MLSHAQIAHALLTGNRQMPHPVARGDLLVARKLYNIGAAYIEANSDLRLIWQPSRTVFYFRGAIAVSSAVGLPEYVVEALRIMLAEETL